MMIIYFSSENKKLNILSNLHYSLHAAPPRKMQNVLYSNYALLEHFKYFFPKLDAKFVSDNRICNYINNVMSYKCEYKYVIIPPPLP